MNEYDEFEEDEIDLSEIDGPRGRIGEEESEFSAVPFDDEDADSQIIIGDNAVQNMLLSYLRANQGLWIRCAPILDEEYFDPEYRPIISLLKDYERTNQVMPSTLVVRADTGIELEVPDDANHPTVEEDIAHRVEEFCRFAAADKVLTEAYESIQTDQTRGTMSSIVSMMEWVSSISVQQDLGYEVHDAVEELLILAEQSDGLPTGFDFLDTALNGGVTLPSFNLVSAASGGGKSIFLQNIAINYIRQGFNVVYISLELPEFMIEKRLAAMMTGVGINSIYQNMDVVVNKMRWSKRKEGKLQIKRMPMSGVTVADIRAYVNELASTTGLEWDHIIIDYMDLMKPVAKDIRSDNIHMKDQAIAVELYDWTHDKISNKVIWTASQQTKGAKDERDARQGAVAGGTGKVNTCDNLLILKRSLEDIQEQRCWGYIEKGRNGGTGMRLPFHWHGETQRMTNPPELEDLFAEANSPDREGGEEPKKKTSSDPIVRAKTHGDNPANSAASDTRSRIMQNRKKRNT